VQRERADPCADFAMLSLGHLIAHWQTALDSGPKGVQP
jgi:hypothetical protein